MDERSEGIILRIRPLTDTSLVVEWLTPELGRISTVAKGARRPKSPFAGKLDLIFEAQFSFQRSRRSELHALREVMVVDSHAGLRKDMVLLHQAAYFTVLVEQGTERETPLPEVHALVAGYLRHLPAPDRIPEAMFAFEFQLLSLLGFAPVLDVPKQSKAVIEASFGNLAPLSRPERIELNKQLRAAVGLALERVPPQRERAIDAMRRSWGIARAS
jgi:DNA repair protein RecO (recombination protein O)